MKQLALVMTIVVLNCASVFAQQKDKLIPIFSATDPAIVATPLNLPAPGTPWKKPRVGNPIPAHDQFPEPAGNFVFVNGALYMRLMMGGSLVAVPGGGASGCFHMDLPPRISGIHDFNRKLEAEKQGRLQER